MSYRHLLRTAKAERYAGYGALLLGFYLLYGAYEGRGRRKPLATGPFLPW
jgi:hypothetical protein